LWLIYFDGVICDLIHNFTFFFFNFFSNTYVQTQMYKQVNVLNLLHVAEPCELYCTDTDDTLIVPWGDSVMDGTPCNVGTRDMCINGICKVSISSNALYCNIL